MLDVLLESESHNKRHSMSGLLETLRLSKGYCKCSRDGLSAKPTAHRALCAVERVELEQCGRRKSSPLLFLSASEREQCEESAGISGAGDEHWEYLERT